MPPHKPPSPPPKAPDPYAGLTPAERILIGAPYKGDKTKVLDDWLAGKPGPKTAAETETLMKHLDSHLKSIADGLESAMEKTLVDKILGSLQASEGHPLPGQPGGPPIIVGEKETEPPESNVPQKPRDRIEAIEVE